MKVREIECLVLLPAGPDTPGDYLTDTLASIAHHMAGCVTGVIDDSRTGRFASAAKEFPNVVVVEAARMGEGMKSVPARGGLFVKEALAVKALVERYRFDLLLKMDTDALVIGDAPHRDVLAFLRQHPDVGIVGAFLGRGDGTPKKNAMATKGRQLTSEMSARNLVRRPRLALTLRRLVRQAERHGYTRGDTCTGGAFFVSDAALRMMLGRGYLDLPVLAESALSEDTLFSLLSCACGYRLSDLTGSSDVLAINWRGLPMEPDELVRQGKKIVHPIKDSDPSFEPRIRKFFHERRDRIGHSGRDPQ
jgi:hypothetical protein